MKNKTKIVIITGTYPPEMGGQSQYSKNLKDVWLSQGYAVSVEVFSRFNWLPSGLRHIIYFFSIIPKIIWSDYIFIIDTFSAALPATLAAWILGKKTVLRTGGDFLWEAYVERTGDKVLLRNFYTTSMNKFSLKEKFLFNMIKWLLLHTSLIIWSTEWQKNIFVEPYGLAEKMHVIVENYYGPMTDSDTPAEKVFVASSRKSKWKNIDFLEKTFSREDIVKFGVSLYTKNLSHDLFLEKIRESYAVIIASLGDISPNVILDAISCQKPFILTRETGIYERVKDIAIFVDPLDENDIAEKVCWLSDQSNYAEQKNKLKSFDFTHTWQDIASEYISAYNSIKNL